MDLQSHVPKGHNGLEIKTVLIWIVFLYTLLFSGIIFGFSSLQLLLEKDGVLSNECDESSDDICESRDLKLKLVYTVSTTVFMFGAFVAGVVVDLYGPTISSMLTTCFISTGFIFLAIAENEQFDLYMLGGVFLGFGGSFAMLNAFPLGFLVEPEKMSFIFTAINCLFDSSGVFFFLCYLVYSNTGVGRASLFWGCAGVTVLLGAVMVGLWYMLEPELHRRTALVMGSDATVCGADGDVPLDSGVELTAVELVVASTDVEGLGIEADIDATDDSGKSKSKSNSAGVAGVPSANCSWHRHLVTPKFAFIAAFASMQVLRTNTYFGYVKNILEGLGDAHTGYLYSQVFIAGLPCSFVFIPLIEWANARLSVLHAFHLITLVGYVYGVGASIPVLPLQVGTFLAFYAFRAYLYSMLGFYFAYCFGPRSAGRLYGSMTLVASAVNLLQYPAYYLLDAYGAPLLYLSLFLLLVNACCSLLVWGMLTPLQHSLAFGVAVAIPRKH